MDNNEIRELADLMIEKGLSVLEMNARGETIRLERGTVCAAPAPAALAPAATATPNVLVTEAPAVQKALPAATALHEIKSPTVGTFYAAPEPDKDPYVVVGDKVDKGETLCLLEAMKMLNEITADRAGVITEICVQNKQVVEYGQPLFRIDTSAE